MAVIGSEPEIYFYARRRAATGYIYMYPLMEPHPFARRMQEDMIAELEREAPRFMVLVNVDTSWCAASSPTATPRTWRRSSSPEAPPRIGGTPMPVMSSRARHSTS